MVSDQRIPAEKIRQKVMEEHYLCFGQECCSLDDTLSSSEWLAVPTAGNRTQDAVSG